MQQTLAKSLGFRAVAYCFKQWYMRARPDWNKMGPQLPAWFRIGLRAIDPRLVPQFIPPVSKDPRGCDPLRFPNGVWWICARMRNSRRWLSKRPAYVMTDTDGGQAKPTRQLLRILRLAKAARRKGQADKFEREFLRSIEALNHAEAEKSKDKLIADIVQTMRKRNMSGRSRPTIAVPALPGR